jgi:hypothetical protein
VKLSIGIHPLIKFKNKQSQQNKTKLSTQEYTFYFTGKMKQSKENLHSSICHKSVKALVSFSDT